MKSNMGISDKFIRIAAAVLIAILYFTNIISGSLALILSIIAFLFILTSFISFCPIYHFLGISTKKNNTKSQQK